MVGADEGVEEVHSSTGFFRFSNSFVRLFNAPFCVEVRYGLICRSEGENVQFNRDNVLIHMTGFLIVVHSEC